MKLDIARINFNDIEDVCIAARDIIDRANRFGLLTGISSRQTVDGQQIVKDARVWTDQVRSRIETFSPGIGLTLIATFQLIYRLAYNYSCDNELCDSIKLRAFDAYMNGDKTVDTYLLYRTISAEIRAHNIAFIGRPLTWLSTILDKWHRNFKTGTSTAKLSEYDASQQVNILLDEDLYAFDPNPKAYKQRLLANHPQIRTIHKTL